MIMINEVKKNKSYFILTISATCVLLYLFLSKLHTHIFRFGKKFQHIPATFSTNT